MATFYVSPTGSDTNTGLSAGSAFRTLAKAQAAMAASSGADTTRVESGTYTAGATLTAANSGDTIRADTGATPILDGGGAAKTFLTIAGANNLTISGLTFRNTATGNDNDAVKPAVLVTSGTGETIQGDTFTSLGSAVIFDAGSGKVDGNKITDMGSVAVRVRDEATGVTVSNNTIAHSSYDLPEGGAIELLGVGKNTVTHNTINNSAYNGIWDESAGGNAITWNKVTNSVLVESDGGGIYAFAPSSGDTISYNYVTNSLSNPNLNWGIYLDDNVNNTTVFENYAQGGEGGVDVHGGDNNIITDNVLIGRSFGLTVMGTGDPGAAGLSDNTAVNHNLIDGVAAFDWGANNHSDYNVFVGTPQSQLGYDPGSVAQWQATGQDTHTLLDASVSGELKPDGTFAPGSKALQLRIPQLDFSQVGAGGTTEPPPPPPPPGGDGIVDKLALILAESGGTRNTPIHFIVSADGAQIGSGSVTNKYADEKEFDFLKDLAKGQHAINIKFDSGPSNGTLWINDVGAQTGATGPVHWTQDNWTSIHLGGTLHATITV